MTRKPSARRYASRSARSSPLVVPWRSQAVWWKPFAHGQYSLQSCKPFSPSLKGRGWGLGPSALPSRIQHADLLRAHSLLQQKLALRFQGACGTDTYALPAQHAGRFGDGAVEEGTDLGLVAAAFEVDGVGVLCIVRTDLHTAPAQQALGIIPDVHRVVVFDRDFTSFGI